MKQTDKDLLLKDLSERLPYGVVVKTPQGDGYLNEISLGIFGHELGVNIKATERTRFKLEECKPYLRSMSSMTEKEKLEVKEYLNSIEGKLIRFKARTIWVIDYLNSIHVDYRGLISKGLAFEASKDMYKL